MQATSILFALSAAALLGACGDDGDTTGAGGDAASSDATDATGTTDATATTSDATTSDATSSSASSGGGAGGGTECPRGSHLEGDTCASALVEWTAGPSLAQKRDHHATVVVESDGGPFLVVMGGVVDNTEDLDSIEMAPIQPDGSLGAFVDGGALPETVAGGAVAVVGRTVLLIGGFRTQGGNHLSDAVDVAQVGADGVLGDWTEGPKVGPTRFHGAAAVNGDAVYLVGGLTGNNTNNTEVVERTVVSEGGIVGTWVATTPLPEPRSHHGLVASMGGLWITGGLTGNPAGVHTDFDDVLFAPFLEDGELGDWTTVSALPYKVGTHSSFETGGYLYVVGGVKNNASNTDEVWRAPIAEGGTIGEWEQMPSLPSPRAHEHQSPLYDGFVYAPGGALHHMSIADVFVGRFE